MYNDNAIQQLISLINENAGLSKEKLREKVVKELGLISDRSVYYCDDYTIRFSTATSKSFSNSVVSLSRLSKHDDKPFIVCVTLPKENYLLLANTTLLKKISHSSQKLTVDTIRGTFLGSDILREFNRIKNEPANFKELYLFHEQIGFDGNLERLVEATNNIVGTKTRVELTKADIENIHKSPERALQFFNSNSFIALKEDLENRVKKVQNEIGLAASIANVNLRGRTIEYLITADDSDPIKKKIIDALHNNSKLPKITTHDKLGDYSKKFGDFIVETDIKTKVLSLTANPKAYNIDKLLEFLSKDKSVYCMFFVGIDEDKNISTRLCSIFQTELLKNTKCIYQWAGRETRGVTQLYGHIIKDLLSNTSLNIDIDYSISRLKEMINL